MDMFIATARGFLGTPFVHQGRAPGLGLDCAGVAVAAGRELGAEIDDFLGYGRVPSAGVFYEKLGQHCDRVQIREMRRGDFLIFEFDANPQHLAILTEDSPTYILHASQPHRKVVEHRMDEAWKKKIRAVFRMRGVV